MSRFDAPTVETTAEIRWLLLRAYGPSVRELGAPIDGGEALLLARRFWLGGRIAARNPQERLAGELGEEAAAELRGDLVATLAIAEILERGLERVAAVATRLGFPFALLKFAALRWSPEVELDVGATGRAASDIDLLVAPEHADALQRALLAAGLGDPGFAASRHQLSVLASPEGRFVEVHRHLPGVRLGEGSVTLPELAEAGLLVSVPSVEGECFAPARDVLVAHLLVHGLVQHGLSPHSYPLARVLADLVDLGVGSGEGAAEPWRVWIAAELDEAEVEAALTLTRWLAAGEVARSGSPETPAAGRLLAHLLAGRLDRAYADSLRLRNAFAEVGDASRVATVLRLLWRAVHPTRAALESIYGPGRSRWRLLALRLWRPFDLVARWWRYRRQERALARRGE